MLFFILGAPDPEMAHIEVLLKTVGVPYGYALDGNGVRVRSSNAYQAEGVSSSKEPHARSVWVECGPLDSAVVRQEVVDHHRSGDPGYECGPSLFMPASSIGQTIGLLAKHGQLPISWRSFSKGSMPTLNGAIHYVVRHRLHSNWIFHQKSWYCLSSDGFFHEVPRGYVLAAAADHCLGHAYKEACPGVDAGELRQWRIRTRARWQGVSKKQIEAGIECAAETIRRLPRVMLGGFEFRLAETEIKEVAEASAILGEPVMYSRLDSRSGRLKVAARNGCFQQMKSWMDWAKIHLSDVYGDPARGFAGGYLG